MCWNHNFQPYGSALGWAEFWVSHRMKILQPVPGWDHLPGKSVLLCSDWNFLVVIFLFGLYWQTWMLSKRSQFSKIKIIVPINFISKLLNLLHAFFECWCHLVSCTNTAASLFMQDVFKMLNVKNVLVKGFFCCWMSRNAMALSLLKCCVMILTSVKQEGFLHIPGYPLGAREAK